ESMQCMSHSIHSDPITGTLVAQSRAPAAGTLAGTVSSASDGVAARPGNLQNSWAAVKCSIERDYFIANDLRLCNAAILKDLRDPFLDAGHGGSGHAAAGCIH